MRNIKVKVFPSASKLKKKQQLAWKIAEIASDNAKLNQEASLELTMFCRTFQAAFKASGLALPFPAISKAVP